MKKSALLLMILFPLAAIAADKEIKVTVKGMVCGFCAQGITKKFKKESAVNSVDVNLDTKLVGLNLKDNAEISDSQIETILKDAGYTVEKIDRSGK